MDWLLNVLKYAPNSNGGGGGPPPSWPTSTTAAVPFVNSSGQPSPTPAAPSPAGNPQQMPGLWGSLMNRFQPGNPQQDNPQQGNQQNAGNQFLMNQAMSLMKGPQFQPTQWMPWMGR